MQQVHQSIYIMGYRYPKHIGFDFLNQNQSFFQVGITWPSASRLISVALDGRLIAWDLSSALSMEGVVDGTQGPLNCVASDPKTGSLIYGGTSGTVAVTPPSGPSSKALLGKGIQHIIAHSERYAGSPEACVISLDDCVRKIDLESGELSAPVEVKEFVVAAGWLDTVAWCQFAMDLLSLGLTFDSCWPELVMSQVSDIFFRRGMSSRLRPCCCW